MMLVTHFDAEVCHFLLELGGIYEEKTQFARPH